MLGCIIVLTRNEYLLMCMSNFCFLGILLVRSLKNKIWACRWWDYTLVVWEFWQYEPRFWIFWEGTSWYQARNIHQETTKGEYRICNRCSFEWDLGKYSTTSNDKREYFIHWTCVAFSRIPPKINICIFSHDQLTRCLLIKTMVVFNPLAE